MPKLLLSLLLLSTAMYTQADVEVGDQAPAFTLAGSDGKSYTLADFKDKAYVVIAFFPKAFTGGWTIECKALRDSDKEIQNFEVAYFMASTDSLEDNKGFAEKNEATFPILSDPEKKMTAAYGVLSSNGYAKRWTFYIDKKGTIQRIDKAVRPQTAGKTLVSSLQELKVPARLAL